MAAYVVGVASVTKTITVNRPGREEETFTAELRVRDIEEQEALEAQERKKNQEWEEEERKAREEGREPDYKLKPKAFWFVREDVLALGGFVDTKGNDVEMTAAKIKKQLNDQYVLKALYRAWNHVQQGVSEYTAKN